MPKTNGSSTACDTTSERPNSRHDAAISVAMNGGCPGSLSAGMLPHAVIPLSYSAPPMADTKVVLSQKMPVRMATSPMPRVISKKENTLPAFLLL